VSNYRVLEESPGLVKIWDKNVPGEEAAFKQIKNLSGLPFIHRHVAIMPDFHSGRGAVIGSVIPTHKAVIPAAVGVDLGCGMMAVQTDLTSDDLPDNLRAVRSLIERNVPHGRTDRGGRNDRGAWGRIPNDVAEAWKGLESHFKRICDRHPKIAKSNNVRHLSSLGGGNHFIEVCLDETDRVWVMLHSGSRGVGNRIGSHFIGLAKREMERWHIHLPDSDLAYLPEGSKYFNDYVEAVGWAQKFARINRELMMARSLSALSEALQRPVETGETAVNCHHNYIEKERHWGQDVWVTRKGAVSAREGELGIIPGAMGQASFIVRGKGNRESFCSCSHGAGRLMSRTEARKRFTVEDHMQFTTGLECRKDADVVDETPRAYKDVHAVMAAQQDLVEPVHQLRALVCVKG
jgi:tRNA-splicing ligase RtcB